jgi:hypothetical protein
MVMQQLQGRGRPVGVNTAGRRGSARGARC